MIGSAKSMVFLYICVCVCVFVCVCLFVCVCVCVCVYVLLTSSVEYFFRRREVYEKRLAKTKRMQTKF